MYQNFTDGARAVMQLANSEANQMKHEYIGSEHIFWGLIHDRSNFVCKILVRLGLNLDAFDQELRQECGARTEEAALETPHKTPRAKHIVDLAIAKARSWGEGEVREECLLLGLLQEEGGIVGIKLREKGFTVANVEAAIISWNNPGADIADELLRNALNQLVADLGFDPGQYVPALIAVRTRANVPGTVA